MRWPTTASSDPVTPTPCTPGSTATRPRAWPASSRTNTAATAGVGPNRRDELQQRLRQGPGALPATPVPAAADSGIPRSEAADAPAPAAPDAPVVTWDRCRWTLPAIRASFDWLADYSLSGVWRLLQRCGLRL